MKILYRTAVLSSIIAISSCGGENDGTNDANSNEKEVVTVNTIKSYNLMAEGNQVSWERFLHQGPTKKTIKIFGSEAEVEIGEVKLNTSGDFSLKSGVLIEYNDEITGMTLLFDMTTLKLNTDMEKGDNLFKTKEFGSSELRITEVVKDASCYVLNGELEIAGVSNPVSASATIKNTEKGKGIVSNLVIQTLNWPLRDESAKKSVITDEITIQLNLLFEEDEVKRDSVITHE